MKKIIPLLIISILVLTGLSAIALPNEDVQQKKTTFAFSKLSIEEKEEYLILELDGTNSLFMNKDHYMVPTLIETFTFPFGTQIVDVECSPENTYEQKLTKELMVSPEPISANRMSIDVTSERKITALTLDSWYDYNVGVGIKDGERVVIVKTQLFPIQYYPDENLIEWSDKMDINIHYIEPKEPLLVNDEYQFLILTSADYTSELNAFVTHKTNRGISTKLVTLDEVYGGTYFPAEGRDDKEQIKYFIKNAIENWGTSYLMLVGGYEKFPARETHLELFGNEDNPDDEVFISELYYADIYGEGGAFSSWDTNDNDIFGEYDWTDDHNYDDVDLYPDVYIGRLAGVSSQEVTTCINKIINYENNEAYKQEWFTEMVAIGGDHYPGDDNAVDEGEVVNEAVIDIMDGFMPYRIWDTNGRLSSYLPKTGVKEISDAIGAGCGFVNFAGHGNLNVWATHPHEDSDRWIPTPTPFPGGYLNTDIAELTNGEELPVVIIGACSTCKYNKLENGFGWSFMSNSNGGGIAVTGASGLDYFYIGSYVTEKGFENLCINEFEAYKNGALTFGEIWAEALTEYISPSMDDVDYKTVEELQPFGDPTLAIAEESQPPSKPARPEGPTSGNTNEEYTYISSSTDPEGDQIYYQFSWGDGTGSGWLGPYASGATVEAKHIWTTRDTYEIKVVTKDTHGALSSWSDPLSVNMPRNKMIRYHFLLEILEKLLEQFRIPVN